MYSEGISKEAPRESADGLEKELSRASDWGHRKYGVAFNMMGGAVLGGKWRSEFFATLFNFCSLPCNISGDLSGFFTDIYPQSLKQSMIEDP